MVTYRCSGSTNRSGVTFQSGETFRSSWSRMSRTASNTRSSSNAIITRWSNWSRGALSSLIKQLSYYGYHHMITDQFSRCTSWSRRARVTLATCKILLYTIS